jgi:hypothetical protein
MIWSFNKWGLQWLYSESSDIATRNEAYFGDRNEAYFGDRNEAGKLKAE